MEDIDKQGIEFLNQLYKDMYKSEDVMHGIDERYIGNKIDNISRYINRMEELHQRVGTSNRENDLKMLKELYYQKYVIKEEDIKESYWEHQKEIYLERGYGHVDLSEEEKHKMVLQIINNQKKSLDEWIEYFVNSDSSYIPMWAKYWAFQGMLSLGNYDKKTKTFGKRSKGTTAPFVDLNREVLALSIDFLLKSLNKESIEDKQLEVLIQGGSFGKIYSYILNNFLNNNKYKKSNKGIWIKYNCGTDHMPLVKSLQGYNTGWCTAGEETAKYQLSMGDFYVYYTYNEKKEAKVPRIAIRMDGISIAEVRGIAKKQNIEPEMEDIVEQKLNEFKDKNKYKKKVSDMKKLTEIYNKLKDSENLEIDELRFLYEIDEKIDGFGYEKDSRIKEILNKRNAKKDLSIIFNCNEEQVGIDIVDLNKQLVVFYGSLNLSHLKSAKDLNLPKIIVGDLYLNSLEDIECLVLPEVINGNLDLYNLKTAEGLVLPKTINGSLNLSLLSKAKGLIFPKTLNGFLYLSSLENAEGLELPEVVNGNLFLNKLKTTKGMKMPKILNGSLFLSSLINIDDLELPNEFNGSIYLYSLETIKNLKLPEILNGDLDLASLQTIEGLSLPKVIKGYLNLGSIKNAKGLTLPNTINGDLILSSLEDGDGLVLPEIVNGDLELFELESLDGVVLPKKFRKIYLANSVVVTPDNVWLYTSKPKTKKLKKYSN